MHILDQYKEVFKSKYNYNNCEIKSRIQKLHELDQLMPPCSTYILITNTQTCKYEFISKNFEYATGLCKKELIEEGITKYLSLIHPDEIKIWLQLFKELMAFHLSNYRADMHNRIHFQYNYRFRVGDNKYINVLENQAILHADTEGRPIVVMGHFTEIGDGDHLPLNATLRILNEDNQYKTIFHKTYGANQLEDIISTREIDIIKLIALGHTNNYIAEKLSISSHTVRTHRKNLLSKTNSKNSIDLVARCIREGLI